MRSLGDLADSSQLRNLFYQVRPDEVYHLGAQSHVRVSFDMPDYMGDIAGVQRTYAYGLVSHANEYVKAVHKGGSVVLETVKMEVKFEAIIEAVRRMRKEEREAFLEDLLASTSPEYLASVREAREQYKAGKVKTHQEVFGR